MTRVGQPFVICCILGAAILGGAATSFALYSYSNENVDVNFGGFVGAGGWAAKYPGTFLYGGKSDQGWYGDFRMLADGAIGENFSFRVNLLENVRTTPELRFGGKGNFQRDVERSSIVYWQQHDSPNTQSAMVLDSMYVKYGNWNNALTIGRQPVTTTVTFFFTPNDFFAPFSPNTFFRVYKPGVDAIRYERKLKALSQLSLISVLGYDADPQSDSGWEQSPDWEKSSVIGRITHTVGLFEFGGLIGIVREATITGVSLQGELFGWLGIRSEAHYANSWSEIYESGTMATLSLEHRYPSSLTVRLEYMFNDHDADSISETLLKQTKNITGQNYLGRHYTALDLSYEIMPLLFGEILYLQNWSDDSFSLSFNAVYSVSDESDLAITLSFPGGDEPVAGIPQSELGSLPVQFSLEYRMFF